MFAGDLLYLPELPPVYAPSKKELKIQNTQHKPTVKTVRLKRNDVHYILIVAQTKIPNDVGEISPVWFL